MSEEFINLTAENLSEEHLCCIIRSRKPHAGVEEKRAWLAERLMEGHVFRKLNAKGCCFIEYAPLEKAWVPIVGEGFYYIYCLWVDGEFKGKGYGKQLMEYCLSDAREKGAAGVCMLGAKRQKHWLSNQEFARKFGFRTVDSTADGYELLSLSFDGTQPQFTDASRNQTIDYEGLRIYYSSQCPYIPQKIEEIKRLLDTRGETAELIHVDSLEKAKSLPCVFNNWGVFYKGRFETVNLLSAAEVEKLLDR